MITDCNGEGGLSDVVAARAGVAWEYDGCDGGNHTLTEVEVYASGPGSELFDDIADNTEIGELLFDAVGR